MAKNGKRFPKNRYNVIGRDGGGEYLIASYDPAADRFHCNLCDGLARWEGGRFGPENLAHTMEVLRCEKCGHAIDPAQAIDRAIKARDAHEARSAALVVAKEAKAKLEAKVRFENNYRRAVIITATEAVIMATAMISLMGIL